MAPQGATALPLSLSTSVGDESLNAHRRRPVDAGEHFPTEQAALKSPHLPLPMWSVMKPIVFVC
ncbi:hypothetical protein [Terrabacter sp. GCM10028922]|uniref:hypothetical protein n=1 Tax=Terrabacter sp. GCM10028922 TaxID=3273428 RepID=UPI0036DF0E55